MAFTNQTSLAVSELLVSQNQPKQSIIFDLALSDDELNINHLLTTETSSSNVPISSSSTVITTSLNPNPTNQHISPPTLPLQASILSTLLSATSPAQRLEPQPNYSGPISVIHGLNYQSSHSINSIHLIN